MKAYVICCNDVIVGVVTDDEKLAETRKNEMAEKDYQLEKDIRIDIKKKTMEDYLKIFYWHLHTVDLLE